MSIAWPALCLAAGCGPSSGSSGTLYQRLQSEDPSVRISAIVQAADEKDRKAVPYLVERLSDAESDVRFFAYISLQKITGQTMGYRYYDPPQERAEAVQRWRQWLKDRGAPPAASQPKGVGSP